MNNITVYRCSVISGKKDKGYVDGIISVIEVDFIDRDGNRKSYKVSDLVRDNKKIEELEKLGLTFKATGFPKDGKLLGNLVALDISSKGDDCEVKDISVLFDYYKIAIEKSNQTLLNAVKSNIEKIGISIDKFKELNSIKNQYLDECMNNKINFDMTGRAGSCYAMNIKIMVLALNKTADDNTVIKQGLVMNEYMEKETDKVMFRLNSISDLIQQENGVGLTSTSYNIDPGEYFKGCDYEGLDCVTYKETIEGGFRPDATLAFVEGLEENNKLEIQENEREFYEYLVGLIKEAIKVERKCQTDAEVEEYIKQGIGSKMMNDYLWLQCQIALAFNYRHTGTIYSNLGSMLGDTDDDDNVVSESAAEAESDAGTIFMGWDKVIPDNPETFSVYVGGKSYSTSKKDYMAKKHDFLIVPMLDAQRTGSEYGFLIYRNIITSTDLYLKGINNSFKYAEALVKLLRWGSRKAKCLYVTGAEENGVKLLLDLNNPGTVRDKIDTSVIKPDRDEMGRDAKLKCLIWADSNISDRGFVMKNDSWCKNHINVPVGALYEVSYKDGQIVETYAVDVVGLKNAIENEGRFQNINGLDDIQSYELSEQAGKDVTLYEVVKGLASGEYIKDNNYEVSKVLQDEEVPVDESQDIPLSSNLLTILADCLNSKQLEQELNKGDSLEEEGTNRDWIASKIAKGKVRTRAEAVKWYIAGKYFKVFMKMNDLLLNEEVDTVIRDSCDIEDLINLYDTAVEAVANSTVGEDKEVDFSAINDLASRVQREQERIKSEPQEVKVEKRIISYNITQPKDLFYWLVKSKTQQEIVGLLHKDSITRQTVLYAIDEIQVRKDTFPTGIKAMTVEMLDSNIAKGLKVDPYTSQTKSKIYE